MMLGGFRALRSAPKWPKTHCCLHTGPPACTVGMSHTPRPEVRWQDPFPRLTQAFGDEMEHRCGAA